MPPPNVTSKAGPTSKLRAMVVEDELPAREYLVELIEASNLAEVVGAIGTLTDARATLMGASNQEIDVAFVDVRLAGDRDESGLDLVRSLAGKPGAPCLVLATAFEAHAIEAFSLDVVDYLLKPFTEARVEQCLRRVLSRREPTRSAPPGPRRIIARRAKALVFLDVDDVWAFEARDRLALVHGPHGAFDVDLTLAAIESSFGRAFVRVHRNWLVNPGHIKEMERDGRDLRIFVGTAPGPDQRGLHVPIGRERVQAVRDLLLAETDPSRSLV